MKYFFYIILTLRLFATDDLELVTLAYDQGLKPVPSNFETLIHTLGKSTEDISRDKVLLGKKLFFEKDLSLGRDLNCASCHSFDKGGVDGRPTAIGHKGQKNPFHLNTPTILNSVFSKKFFWDGHSETLQDQAKGPLQASFEMSITPKLAQKRIRDKKEYRELFEDIYGKNAITFDNIANAISAYEKTLITRGRFDDFLLGDFGALSQEEKDGLELFITKGCIGCHNGIAIGGGTTRKFPLVYHSIWSMAKPSKIKTLQKEYKDTLQRLDSLKYRETQSRYIYMNSQIEDESIELIKNGFFGQIDEAKRIGVMASIGCAKCHQKDTNAIKPEILKEVAFPFENRGGFLGSKSPAKQFRVPLLRNIVQTKPYFHNGAIERLEDAIKIMGTYQVRADLTDAQIAKIVAFFKAVDGKLVDYIK